MRGKRQAIFEGRENSHLQGFLERIASENGHCRPQMGNPPNPGPRPSKANRVLGVLSENGDGRLVGGSPSVHRRLVSRGEGWPT